MVSLVEVRLDTIAHPTLFYLLNFDKLKVANIKRSRKYWLIFPFPALNKYSAAYFLSTKRSYFACK